MNGTFIVSITPICLLSRSNEGVLLLTPLVPWHYKQAENYTKSIMCARGCGKKL